MTNIKEMTILRSDITNAKEESTPNGPWHTPPCPCGRAECQTPEARPASNYKEGSWSPTRESAERMGLIPKPVLTTNKRWANDPMYTGELEERLVEAEVERNRLVDRLLEVDKGCFNCGGLPHTTTCVVRDVKVLLKRAEDAEKAVERLYDGDSGAECISCGRLTANGICTECRHGISPLKKAEAERDALKAQRETEDRDWKTATHKALGEAHETACRERNEVLADRDAALARLNAAGISHAGKLDMGITIALELVERLKKQIHEEDMTRCDLEADLQTFGGVNVEDGLREGIFDLIKLRDTLKAQRDAAVELNKKLQDAATWERSRATQYAAQRDEQAKRLEQLNEMLDPTAFEGLRETIRKLKEALLARCPRHCESDHEFGTCELTYREVAALTEVK